MPSGTSPGPTPLGIEERPAGLPHRSGPGGADREIAIEPDITAALRELTRSSRITLSTLIQGAWALLLSRYSRRSDVVFGVTVAGRPPELPGVETIVGLFINTMPLRVAVDESSGLIPWLVRLQDRLVEMRRFEAVPLARIQGWSDVPAGTPIFERIVTVQNLPFVEALRTQADRLGIEQPRFVERTHYPITALPGEHLRIRVGFDARRFATEAIDRILAHLRALLLTMADDPSRRLAELPWIFDPRFGRLVDHWGSPPDGLAVEFPIRDIDHLNERELDALIERLGRTAPQA